MNQLALVIPIDLMVCDENAPLGGVGRRRLRMQMDRLFHAQVEMIYEDQLARISQG